MRFLLLFLTVIPTAQAEWLLDSERAELRKTSKSSIANLSLSHPQELELHQKSEDVKDIYVRIRARYFRKGWTIMLQDKGKPIATRGKGRFTNRIKLTGKNTSFTLMVIGPQGEVEKATYSVSYKNFGKSAAKTKKTRKKRKRKSKKKGPQSHFFSASLGPTYILFTQDQVEKYNALALTVKAAYRWQFNEDWEFGGNTFFNALIMANSRPDRRQARFLGINGRAGYRIPVLDDPFVLKVHAGWYYITMLVEDDHFGIINIQGPQIFPTFTYKISRHQSAGIYFKYSPVMAKFFEMKALDTREIALGAHYTHTLLGQPLRFAIDLSNLEVDTPGRTASSWTYSISAGYEF